MFGYIDESGSPGIASHNKDCLVVSLVLFESEEAKDKSAKAINDLRTNLNLPDDYEFHCSSNSTRPQAEFRKKIRERKLSYIKIKERNSRHSSLIQLADYVVNISAKKVLTKRIFWRRDLHRIFTAMPQG